MKFVHKVTPAIVLLALGLAASVGAAERAIFPIDGLTLGSNFSGVSSKFKCHESYYSNFTFCVRTRTEPGQAGPVTFGTLAVHKAGDIVFLSQTVEPAYFAPEAVMAEIQRLSVRIGQEPRTITIQNAPLGIANAIIAAWGDLSLSPISDSDRELISSGRDVNLGYLIDFLNDFKKSVSLGQPIFRCYGRGGYIWAATYDEQGKGILRYRAVNQEAVDLEIERVASLIRSLQGDIAQQLQLARPLAGGSPSAEADLSRIESDARDPSIAFDHKKLTDIANALRQFIEQRRVSVATEQQRVEHEVEERQKEELKHEKLKALRSVLAGIDAGSLSEELHDEYQVLNESLDEKAEHALSDEAVNALSARVKSFSNKYQEAREKGVALDEIRDMRKFLESQQETISDQDIKSMISGVIIRSAPASLALSLSDLNDLKVNLREVKATVVDYDELMKLRATVKDRIISITQEISRVIGDVPEVEMLKSKLDDLNKKYVGETLTQLQLDFTELNALYERDKGIIKAHSFTQF
jgi:hypothetical protein